MIHDTHLFPIVGRASGVTPIGSRVTRRPFAKYACACLLTIACIASAAESDNDVSLNGDGAALGSLARSLVGWVENATGHDVEMVVARPPDIVFVSPGDRIVLPDESVSVHLGMAALYSPSVNAIFLVLPWSLDDEHDQSLLLQQLARAVLHANSLDTGCTDLLEEEAYALLTRWSSERDIAPAIAPPTSETPPTCRSSLVTL